MIEAIKSRKSTLSKAAFSVVIEATLDVTATNCRRNVWMRF
jgi:hypothetical protein